MKSMYRLALVLGASATLTVTLATSVLAQNKVIYGEDNRVDVDNSNNANFQEWARSTAAMIPNGKLTKMGTTYKLSGPSLSSAMGVCKTEPFADQITSAMCSGFLLGPDVLVTAGHCIRSANDCANNSWVFDYKISNENQGTSMRVPESSVYKCKSIIARALSSADQKDFAVIRLERVVTDRNPLPFRRAGTEVEENAELVVIGHPSGLPTKIADGAFVRDNDNPVYFVANLDTYGGNSGSAVFNAQTGEVEGILVRGENDYVYRNGCQVSNVCPMSGCRGEDVTRITVVEGL